MNISHHISRSRHRIFIARWPEYFKNSGVRPCLRDMDVWVIFCGQLSHRCSALCFLTVGPPYLFDFLCGNSLGLIVKYSTSTATYESISGLRGSLYTIELTMPIWNILFFYPIFPFIDRSTLHPWTFMKRNTTIWSAFIILEKVSPLDEAYLVKNQTMYWNILRKQPRTLDESEKERHDRWDPERIRMP